MSVFERLKASILDYPGIDVAIDVEKITPEASLRADLGFDSLDEVGLELLIEEEFAIEVPMEASDNWRLVSDVVAFIEHATAASGEQS